jgi:anti-anti-sigma regulatory factor
VSGLVPAWLDCFAVRALLEIRQMAQRAGGDVLPAAPGKRIQRVLTLTGYAGRFCIYPTVTAAMARMRGPSAWRSWATCTKS